MQAARHVNARASSSAFRLPSTLIGKQAVGGACDERVVWWWWLRCLMRRGTLQVAVEEMDWGCDCQETAGESPGLTTSSYHHHHNKLNDGTCVCVWCQGGGCVCGRTSKASKGGAPPQNHQSRLSPCVPKCPSLSSPLHSLHTKSHAARPRRTPYTDTGTISTGRPPIFGRVQSEVKPKFLHALRPITPTPPSTSPTSPSYKS